MIIIKCQSGTEENFADAMTHRHGISVLSTSANSKKVLLLINMFMLSNLPAGKAGMSLFK